MKTAAASRTLVTFALTVITSSVPALGGPARLTTVDPLLQPEQKLERELRLSETPSSTADAKLVPSLWERKLSVGSSERLRVIVLLRTPIVDDLVAGGDPSQAEAILVRHIAALEQDFAREAKATGFTASSGLSHFPIVFGEIEAGHLLGLAAIPSVRAIEDEHIYHVSDATGDGLTKAGQLRSQFAATGAGVGVAILDTGIDENHPEFAGRIVATANELGGSSAQDDEGHGTSVAGVIGGATQGVAPQALLWAVKVSDSTGHSTTTTVLNGLNAVYSSRNQFGGVRVVNMSLGGGGPFNSACDSQFPSLAQVVSQMVSAGIIVFASSGNDGFTNGVEQPACLSQAVAVGAVYDANVGGVTWGPPSGCHDSSSAPDQITCFSDSGVPLAILAPGAFITTAKLGGGFNTAFSGTSAAAPYASGVAALILSLKPTTTATALALALATTGRPLTDVNQITRDRIDALAAYQSLAGGSTAPCVRDASTACLLSDRFEVKVDYSSNTNGSGSAQVMSFGGQRTENDESVFWWFFSSTNFEMGLKILNACGLNNSFWVFISGLTNQGWNVHVRDTQTGATKLYSNAIGHLSQTTADTSALPCP